MNMPFDDREGVVVLGGTGSIGHNALAVLASMPGRFRLEAATCRCSLEKLIDLTKDFPSAKLFCAERPQDSMLPDEEAVLELIRSDRVGTVVCAIQGISALKFVLAALEAGKRVCLATKEVMVAAGEWVTDVARKCGGKILPVDSEHCAVFQCLNGENKAAMKKIWLTCSGGPFHAHPEVDLHSVTPEQALRHPTWNMGTKITLDCATLMNKALEILEAAWLFGATEEQIGVVIHPQSMVHSMVEYQDGAVLAQCGPTDMKLPIQYCLTYPERCPSFMKPLDFTQAMHWDFLPPDTKRFPALELARKVLRMGGAAGAVFNAANDLALTRFLKHEIALDEIVQTVAAALESAPRSAPHSFEEIAMAKAQAEKVVAAWR